MEQFVVSARKYRPSSFNTVVGQHAITSTLKNAIINQHLAQAFLFCGPRGVGKTTCARILAKTINCYRLTAEHEACNECESCTSFNQNSSFNIHELDAASNNSVDDIRNLIEQIRFSPQVGKYSIYIIDEVHMLSTAAFNAFLKTLEEPPAHAIFILATTERHKILPTILSRCQVFMFNRITVEDMARHLAWVAKSENIQADPDGLHIIAQKADGALRDALSMFDQIVSYSGGHSLTYEHTIENLNILDYDYYFSAADEIANGNYAALLNLFDQIIKKGFDGGSFITGLGEHFRNLLVSIDVATLQLLEVSQSVKSRYQVQSARFNALNLIEGMEHIHKAEVEYKASRNQRLTVELVLLKLCKMHMAKPDAVLSPPATTAQPQAQTDENKLHTGAAPAPLLTPSSNATPLRSPGISGLSLKNRISIKGKTPQAESVSAPDDKPYSIQYEVSAHQPVNQEKLENAWAKLVEKKKTEKQNMIVGSLTHTTPVWDEPQNLILYKVQNSTQLNDLTEIKHELLGFLRTQLQNFGLDLHIEVSEEQLTHRPVTPMEKLAYLESLNPQIADLRKRLDLDING